jgi:hypothetical protein
MKAPICHTPRRSRLVWLVRGGTGLALLALAAWARTPIVVLPALVAALIAFRGCPMCWLFELVQHESQEPASSAGQDTP